MNIISLFIICLYIHVCFKKTLDLFLQKIVQRLLCWTCNIGGRYSVYATLSYLVSLKSLLQNVRIKVIANDEISRYLVIYWNFIIQITCGTDTWPIQLIRFICVWENENFFALINSKCLAFLLETCLAKNVWLNKLGESWSALFADKP